MPGDAERERLVVGDLHDRKRDTMPQWLSPSVPVLVAPNSFKGTFRAAQVAGAIGRGLERAGLMPPDLLPLADGGDGTLDALLREHGRRDRLPRRVAGPTGARDRGRATG